MTLSRDFILASGSPRRSDLLSDAGVPFRVVLAEGVTEAHDASLTPAELTVANARLKASAVAKDHPECLVLGADTLVYLDQEPLGKPADLPEAKAMLSRLVGKTHTVCTGVVLLWDGGTQSREYHVLTNVTFRPLNSAAIDHYLTLINPLDKAGSYAAQEHGDFIIERVDGSWTNVVGLPMEATLEALGPWGWKPLTDPQT